MDGFWRDISGVCLTSEFGASAILKETSKASVQNVLGAMEGYKLDEWWMSSMVYEVHRVR